MTPAQAPYTGGLRLARSAALAGGAGLLVTAVGGAAFDARRALYAYLVAFTYWLGIAVGALILLSAFHASNARWPVVLRRFVEHLPAVIPLFVVLFLPILFGRRRSFRGDMRYKSLSFYSFAWYREGNLVNNLAQPFYLSIRYHYSINSSLPQGFKLIAGYV